MLPTRRVHGPRRRPHEDVDGGASAAEAARSAAAAAPMPRLGIRQDLSIDELKALQHELLSFKDALIDRLDALDVREISLQRQALAGACATSSSVPFAASVASLAHAHSAAPSTAAPFE